MRMTPKGAASAVGPLTSVTCAPASRAALATAYPIFPELAFVIIRTGSIGSLVGPAVTRTRFPASTLGWKKDSISLKTDSGSSIRPMPVSPQAWSPASGPAINTPSLRNCAALRWVAALSHIWRFIAGATINGQSRARHNVVSRSSACPCTTFAIKLAEAGATTISSRSRDNSMCPMLSAMRGSQRSVHTVCPDKAWNVTGVMKRHALCVITTRTS